MQSVEVYSQSSLIVIAQMSHVLRNTRPSFVRLLPNVLQYSWSLHLNRVLNLDLTHSCMFAYEEHLEHPVLASLVPRPFLYGRDEPIQEGSGNQTSSGWGHLVLGPRVQGDS